MTEQATEKETQTVVGALTGIMDKGAGKWQVIVRPDGSQYDKNVWTKDAEMVEALRPLVGERHAFVCGVSHWTNQSGQEVRSLWLNQVADADTGNGNAAELAASTTTAPEQHHAAVHFADKDRLITRQTCLKSTAPMFSGALNAGEPLDEVLARFFETAQRMERWLYRDIGDVPFE